MEFPDDFFKDKLYNSEADYSENVSFEKVMDRRRKKRRFIFWWNPKTYATLGVLFLGGLTAFVTHSFNGKTTKTDQVKVANIDSRNSIAKQTTKKDVKTELSLESKIEDNSKNVTPMNAPNLVANLTIAKNDDSKVQSGLRSNKLGGVSETSKYLFSKRNKKTADKATNTLVVNAAKTLDNKPEPISSEQLFGESKFAKISSWANEDIYNLSKWNDRLNSAKPKQNRFGFEGLKLDMPELEFDLPEFEIHLRKTPSKWFAELSVITGSNNTIVFEDDVPLSVLGTQYMAQYQLLVLKDFENGSMFGAGVQFSEWVGNGKWQRTSNLMVPKITTHKVLVSAPWQPKKYAILTDTTYEPVTNVQSGVIEYKIDKVSFPLAYRFCTSIGKLPVRFGMHLAPGYTTVTEGVYFTQTDFRPIQSTRQMTVDGRITLGPMFPITKKWTFVMEPSLIYQSFVTPDNQVNGKFFTGLGVAILRQF